MSLGVLGPVVFEVNSEKVLTWRDARRSASARWVKHEVFQGKPRQEFVGADLDQLRLTVRLRVERGVDPIEEIKRLREEMTKGNVLQFTIGTELIGDFVIKGVDDDWPRISRKGVIEAAEVALSLEEYA